MRCIAAILVVLLALPPVALADEVAAPRATPASLTSLDLADDDALYKCKKFSDGARIRVTLKPETTLTELVAWAMGFSCKSFLYGAGVGARSQKVTVMAPTEMTPRDAYRLFLVSLSSMGLTVVPRGKTLEIIEQSRAKESPLPIVAASALPEGGGMVRAVVRPRHVGSTDLAQVLTGMKSPSGAVLDIPGAGVVVVTDEPPMLERMMEVAALVDVEQRTRILRIELEHADADETLRTLTAALGEKARVKLQPDLRGNALLVIGAEEDFAPVLELVRVIDVPARAGAAPRAHVVRLEHADAEETAGVLGAVFAKGNSSGGGNGTGSGGSPGAPRTLPATPGRGTVASAPGAATSVAAATGEVRISFAKSTNVLIVVASDEDFRSVREVVRELDVQRAQVYVEAVIMELSVEKARQLGFSFHGGTGLSDGSTLIAASQPGGSTFVTDEESAAGMLVKGLSVALLGPSFDLLGISVPSLGALFQAARSNGDIDVLSSPQLLATDHEEAKMAVGENVPYLSVTASTGTFPTGQSVQRMDLDLKFKVRPHVGAGGDVTLEIDLEIKELGASTDLGPTWTTRSLQTKVTVHDQQPIVLGGMMRDATTNTRTSVPILGDIPLLGMLFRSSSTTHQKRNLMIILVPYVVADARDARYLLERKLRERREFETALGVLDSTPYKPHLDYARKRGLVAEIDHQVRAADEDDSGLELAPPAPTPTPAAPAPPVATTTSAPAPPRAPSAR